MIPSASSGRTTQTSAAVSDNHKYLVGLLTTWVFALLPANLVPTIIGRLVADFEVDITTAGFVATGMTLVNAAAVLAFRSVSARGHRALLARIGALLLMVPLLVAVFTMEPVIIMGALVLGGLGSGTLIAASTAAVAATRDPDKATSVVMIVNRLMVAAAFFLIPIIGGGLQTAMLIMIVPGVLALGFAGWLPAAPTTASHESAAPEAGDYVTETTQFFEQMDPRRVRQLGWMLAIGFAAWSLTDDGIFGLVEVFGDAHVDGLESGAVQLLLGFSILCGLAGTLLALPLVRLLGRTNTLIIALVASTLSKIGLTLGTTAFMFSLSACVWGFMFGVLITIVFGLAAQMHRSGSISVLVNGVYIAGVALGPLVSSQIYDSGGVGALTWAMSAIAVVTAAMMTWVSLQAKPAHNKPAGSDTSRGRAVL